MNHDDVSMNARTEKCASPLGEWGYPKACARLFRFVFLAIAMVAFFQKPALSTAIREQSVRFTTVDIFADSGVQGLAAYQVEITSEFAGGKVSLVGVEGGEAGVFSEPPFYDPEALTRDRIILAAYTPGADIGKAKSIPSGKTQVARLHVQITSEAGIDDAAPKPVFTLRVIAAGGIDGTRINAEFSAVQGDGR